MKKEASLEQYAQKIVALEEIINNRRSVRNFSPEIPSQERIEKLLLAGLNAPFAAAAVGERQDFRRFFVIKKDSPARKELEKVLDAHLKKTVKKLTSLPFKLIGLTKKLAKLIERLQKAKLPDSPYIIIIAEYSGMPPVAPQALAHAAENMWLMASADGLGFQLLSMFESMKDNKELCALLGLKPGENAFLGCAIGVPKEPMGPVQRPDAKTLTKWL